MRSAFAEPRFRRLLVGWTISNFGDSALFLTLGIWAKDLTGSNAAAGLVFLALGLPVLFSPLLGHVVDRVQRRRLLIVVNAAAGLGVLSLLLVRDAGDLWLIYLVAAGYGLVGTVTGAAQSGLLRDLLSDEQLDTANGTLSTIDQGLRVVSPLLGAALYAAYGGNALAVMASATFALAVLALLTVPVEESEPDPKEGQRFWQEVTAGYRHVRGTPPLRRIVVSLAVAMTVVGFYDSAVFAVVETGLGREPAFFGVLMSIQGAGSIVGGLTSVLLLRRLGGERTVGASLAGLGASSLLLVTSSLPAVTVGMLVFGACIPWFVVALVTVRQRSTPPRLQGRAAAATRLATQGPQMASIALGSVLIGFVDYRWMIVSATIVLLACGLPLLLRRPHLTEAPPVLDQAASH